MSKPIRVKPPEEMIADFTERLQAPSTIVNSSEVVDEERKELEQGRIHELEKQALELQLIKAQIRKFEDDNEGRREFSRQIFTVMVIWIFLVLMIIVQCARGVWTLADPVLIALITTTTANVIGVFIIVANYLFNRDKST